MEVQFDAMQAVHAACKGALGEELCVGQVETVAGGARFTCAVHSPGGVSASKAAGHGTAAGEAVVVEVVVSCTHATVVASDPHRVLVEVAAAAPGGQAAAAPPRRLWAHSLWALRQAAERRPRPSRRSGEATRQQGQQADAPLAAAVTARLGQLQV